MEGSSSYSSTGKKQSESELDTLQKQHEQKLQMIHELKTQIETVKLHLDKKRNGASKEKMESFKSLAVKYNNLREDYNALWLKG